METEKIDRILLDYKLNKTNLYQARYAILRLFGVVGRSEQLPCDHDYQPDITCGVNIHACTKCGDVI